MHKTIKIVALIPYIIAAWFWEGIRMVWWLWNKTYLVWSRRHSRVEIHLMMWLWGKPGLTTAYYRVTDILEENN